MPKVKKLPSCVHPNSRKAMQMARKEHREMRLDKRKGEANLKLKAQLKKLNWFRNNIDKSKNVYTTEEVHELMEKYLQRFDEEEKEAEEKQSIKGRHCSDRIGHEYKTKFKLERERIEYEKNGFEIPLLTKEDAFKYFANWNGDSKFLPAISFTTISKSTKSK